MSDGLIVILGGLALVLGSLPLAWLWEGGK